MALRPTRPQSRSDQLAQRDAAQQDVFMREVDEALRRDEMLGVFKRYGRPIGAAILLGLTGLAGYLWWDHAQKQNAGEHGEQLTLALDHVEAGRLDTAGKALDSLTKDAGGGTRAAAELMRGGIALQQGHTDEALGR